MDNRPILFSDYQDESIKKIKERSVDKMKQLIFCVIIFLGISHALAAPQKAVLVTGASSGIGLKVTEHLVNNGFYVYAGARKEADLKRLDGMKNITAVRLDVTIQSDIDAAVKIIEKEGRGLFAVVNNAGVGVFSRMSEMPDDEISWIHEVNVMGPVRINRAFLPLLKASKRSHFNHRLNLRLSDRGNGRRL
jgi:NAD(P)-dependent dehydrogenase (short-subunit alcohol dehydrogenase family)